MHPQPPSTSLNAAYRANDSRGLDKTPDAFASLLGVSRPGKAVSKGENKAPTSSAERERHRRNAVAGLTDAVSIGDKSRHHSWIDRHRDALRGIEELTPSSQPMTGSSRRQGKDGDGSTRETPPPSVPYRWWSFFDRTSRNKIGNDESVPSQSRCRAYVPSARVSDDGLYRQGGTGSGYHGGGRLAEAVLSAPTARDDVSGSRVDSAPRDSRAVRRYSGGGNVNINRVGAAGGGSRRGLGDLPRPSSFRLASTRMIEFADDDDSNIALAADEGFVDGTALGETKRSDVIPVKDPAVEGKSYGVSSVDVTAKTSGGSNDSQQVSLGGNSMALSLRDLITSGEFYPGGATRPEQPSELPTAVTAGSGVALAAASGDSRSGDIGLRGHNGKISSSVEYAGVLEEARQKPGHALSDIPRGKERGMKKSSTVAPAVVMRPDIQAGRGRDIPSGPRCYLYTPSTPQKVYGDHTNSSEQQLSSSIAGVPEGSKESEQGVPVSPRRSVSAPVGVLGLGDGSRATPDCRETDPQESLDDFLRKLSVVTGGDVAAGGDRRRRLSELGVGEDRGVDFETREDKRVEVEDRTDAVVRV